MKRRSLLLLIAAPHGADPAHAQPSRGRERAGGRSAQPAAVPLTYPQHDTARVQHWHYLLALLQLAAERAGAAYEFHEATEPMTQARVVREIAGRTGRMDLAWTMTSIEREQQMIPVRVPIDRGLIGYRIAFVRREDQDRWADLRSLDDLKRYTAGQGGDWPDTAVLRDNGLPVQTTSRYELLFDMLRKRRVDYFPRAVFELDGELAGPLAQDLVIEPHVLIRYPAASYLFVRPDLPQVAADLARGLEAAVADGSFQRLFHRHFGELIRRHRLAQRVTLTLRNPLLPPATPLHRPALWLVL